MPNLISYTETTNAECWDAFSPRDFSDDMEVELFGSRNVGQPHLCNLQVAHALPRPDAAFIVDSWWASTNVPANFQILAWMRSATVTLYMGCMPVLVRKLDDLYDQGALGRCLGNDRRCRGLAEILADVCGEASDWDEAKAEKWTRRVKQVRDRLIGVTPGLTVPIVIPCRQTFRVRVQSERRSLGAMLEVLPANIAPQALFWIHLGGVTEMTVV